MPRMLFRSRLSLQTLEARDVPAVFEVTSLADAGAGSLREAVELANMEPGQDTIVFQEGLEGTITLESPINISDSVIIQGPGAEIISIVGAIPPGNGQPEPEESLFIHALSDITDASVISGLRIAEHESALTSTAGGITNFLGTLTVSEVVFEALRTDSAGGAISNFSGGILNVFNSVFLNNFSELDGGAISNGGTLTVDGTLFSNNFAESGGGISNGGDLTVSKSTFFENLANYGAGIDTVFSKVQLENVVFDGNQLLDGPEGISGAGIRSNGGDLSILASTFRNNNATIIGDGGAVYFDGVEGGSLTIEGTTINDNDARAGAGLYADFALPNQIRIVNSTFDNNTASQNGGGMLLGFPVGNTGGGSAELINVTVTRNTATNGGGGISVMSEGDPGDVFLRNNLIALNSVESGGPDLEGTFISEGGNLIGNDTNANFTPQGSDVLNVDPLVGPLGPNLGPNETVPLLAGSPALGIGVTGGSTPTVDQRDFPRPADGPIDAGAYQVQAPVTEPDVYDTSVLEPLVVPAPGVLVNDFDPEDRPLTVSLVSTENLDLIEFNPDGSFTFTPNAVGEFVYEYVASNGIRDSVPTTLTINVTAEAPITQPDFYTVIAGETLNVPAPGVLGNDSDPQDLPLTAILLTEGLEDILTFNSDGSFTFSSTTVGDLVFQYVANNGFVNSAPTNVRITVESTLEPPVALPDVYNAVVGEPLIVSAPGVLINDSDPQQLPLTARLISEDNLDLIQFNEDGSFTFISDQPGTFVYQYVANNGEVDSEPATITITVDSEPPLPPPPPGPTPDFGPFVVGAGAGGSPRVRAFNEDGSLRLDFFAYEEAFTGGVRVATADINGDGVQDIITTPGPGGGPRVRVFDGVTGEVLLDFFAYEPEFTGGVFVAVAAGTENSPPIIVTGAGSLGGPRVRVFNANTGEVLSDFFAYAPDFIGGVRVAVGDLNGDGIPDIITVPGSSGGPLVRVWSGADSSLLGEFFAKEEDYRGGLFVSAVSGTNGVPGLIVLGRDSFGNFGGSVLDLLYSDLFDATGQPIGTPIATSNIVGPADVSIFSFADGTGTLESNFLAYDLPFAQGVRVSTLIDPTDNSLNILTAPGQNGGSLVKRFRIGETIEEVDIFEAFEPEFTGSVYVG